MAENFDRSSERENIAPARHDRQHLHAAEKEIYRARLDSQCALPPEIRFQPENYPLPELTITDPGSQRRPADFDDRRQNYLLQNVREHLASRLVEWRGSASPDHVRTVQESLAQYPTEALLQFARNQGVMEAAGRQRESTIYGEPINYGYFLDRTNRAVVPETVTQEFTRQQYRHPEVRRTTGHELGHAMDRFGSIARNPDFQRALQADLAGMSETDRNSRDGRRYRADHREVFAELFSVVSNQNNRSMVARNNPGTPTTNVLERRRDMNDELLRWFPRTADFVRRTFPPNR